MVSVPIYVTLLRIDYIKDEKYWYLILIGIFTKDEVVVYILQGNQAMVIQTCLTSTIMKHGRINIGVRFLLWNLKNNYQNRSEQTR